MNQVTKLNWLRELLWCIATAIVAIIVLMPLHGIISNTYLKTNLLLVVVALTYFRYTIYLNQVPYLSTLYVRVLLVFIIGVGFWQFMRRMQDFMYIADNYTISTFLVPEKAFGNGESLERAFLYFKQEYLLANIAVLLLSVILGLRTISSLWKLGKKV